MTRPARPPRPAVAPPPEAPAAAPSHEKTSPGPPSDSLWGIDDVARYLAVSRRGVERLRSAGRLPKAAVQIGRLPRWKPDAIREWVSRGGRV